MKRDAHGLEVTTDVDAVITGLDSFTAQFMGAHDEAAGIFALAAAHPQCALVQMYAAALHLYSQSNAAVARDGLPYLQRARAQRESLTERERVQLEALDAWMVNDYQRAIALHERIADHWPRDVIAAKLGEFLFYLAPDYQRHLRFVEPIAAANRDSSHVQAMHAFALEMAGQHARAEAVARDAVAQDLYTPWAHHALAHLFLNDGRIGEGRTLLEGFAPTWMAHSFATRAHNMWHLALFNLADLHIDRALHCYREIWGTAPDSTLDHVDAVSLLWRVELAGRPLSSEWTALAAHFGTYPDEQVFPFLNAHYVYALTRAGRRDEALCTIELMQHYAARQPAPYARLWGDVGVPLAQGCVAFAEGDYARAAVLLDPIQDDVTTVGGSDAQNDLFKQTYLVSLVRSKRSAEAARLLAHRIGSRAPTALENSWR